MKIPGRTWAGRNHFQFGTLLFDLAHDPQQEQPLTDPLVEQRMIGHLVGLMRANDAPVEQYARLGLTV
ncbi:MAG: hypothetical protein R3A44_27610 [Caldilineaceae bacterium]